MKKHLLVDKTIMSIDIASDRKAIRFALDDGKFVIARAEGDCCSETWIESISLPALGFPALVISAADVDMPDLGAPQDEDSECRQYYGFEIVTDKGSILIDYRNESNGYYGGNLAWPGEHFYGGVFGQNRSTEEWEPAREKA